MRDESTPKLKIAAEICHVHLQFYFLIFLVLGGDLKF